MSLPLSQANALAVQTPARFEAHDRHGRRRVAGLTALATGLAIGGIALLLAARRERPTPSGEQLRTGIARQLNAGASILSLAVLADSGIEHYRGSFENAAMYTPIAVASLSLAISLHGAGDARKQSHPVRDGIYAVAALTGLIGTGFHIYNINKRPGRWSFQNLFYGAPLGAPFALLLAGLLGVGSERVRDAAPGSRPEIFDMDEGTGLAAVSAIGLLGTVGEVALFHFRGAYHNPFMYVPIVVPPVAAVLMSGVALTPRREPRPLTRLALRLTALVGVAGVGFHAYGVSRHMGGWRNWSQNLIEGPPLPAPPSFTGLAVAALGILRLIEAGETV